MLCREPGFRDLRLQSVEIVSISPSPKRGCEKGDPNEPTCSSDFNVNEM